MNRTCRKDFLSQFVNLNNTIQDVLRNGLSEIFQRCHQFIKRRVNLYEENDIQNTNIVSVVKIKNLKH